MSHHQALMLFLRICVSESDTANVKKIIEYAIRVILTKFQKYRTDFPVVLALISDFCADLYNCD